MLNNPDKTEFRDPISLNVGGQVYTTTLSTLTRFEDSMLGAMFRGNLPLLRDRKGNYVIDRDGKVFRHILNYLRSSSLDLPQDFNEMQLLKREADFYQIGPLLDELGRHECGLRQAAGRSAVLTVDVHCQARTLHFNLKKSPENYELFSCTVQVCTANVFCTSRAVVELLCSRFSYQTPEGAVAPQAEEGQPNYLRLQWTPRPAEMPVELFNKHGYRQLTAAQLPSTESNSVQDARGFVAWMLQLALAEGFRVDSVFPDSADILNCGSLRCVRY
ncbi:BTB/POZ domain-containing protein KCTD21-like [Polyodon spathula]|uniref:BTB/POZ domain-containing protein KCTD21-like n=1 Tax=Polyodon spathula TaxID=7913 RepID=UPI001B7EC50F|nr:BTB/POZ domain-containing protein KCTD21-like [Polyodon spathula]